VSIAVIADNSWGFRGSGRGRPRGEFGAGDGVSRRNMSEMVAASNFHLVSTDAGHSVQNHSVS